MPTSGAGSKQIGALKNLLGAQNRLVQAVQELSLVRTLTSIQEVVRRAAREMTGADGATFVLRDGDQCHYADEDAISPLWKGQRFPLSACVSGWVMTNAQAVAIPDIFADPRVPIEAYRPTFVRSMAMVPIRLKSPIGAIGVYWASPRETSGEQLALIQALANTTAVAMENVQVYTELERRVALRTRQLEALNRELESFSYSVSHDLRGPLRTINGFIELLERELPPSREGPTRQYIRAVQASSTKMGELIEDLLKLAKVARQELRRIDVDLAKMARDIAVRLKTEDPSRQVDIVIPAKLPAQADAGLTAVVMENLISNAWKYTGKTPHARIEVGVRDGADGIPVFYVRDNGVGFDPKRAENLFTPFQRLHSSKEFPGTGVGLATVQRIIHRHGGRIWAEAEPGRGATFAFTFSGGN